MALSKEDRAEAEGLAKALVEPLQTELATLKETVGKLPNAESVTKSVTDAVAPLKETIAKIGTTAKPPEKKPGEKDDPAADPNAEIAALRDELKKVTDTLGGITSERTKAQEREAAKKLVETSLVELKVSGLLKMPRLLDRIIAGNPKTKEDVQKLVDSEREYAKEMGVDVKSFGADVAAEDGKTGEGAGQKQDSEAIAKQILERKNTTL